MSWKQQMILSAATVLFGLGLHARAYDLKLTIPKSSHMTPVQKLNREGVENVRKHNLGKAEMLFYKAYLLDPDDPFTLNNLGYVAEIQGQVDRAQRFYALATQQPTDAVIDRASSKRVEGHSVADALAVPDLPLQINHANVEAVRLLSQGRAPEADLLLQKTLQSDPRNVFTLNNMGVAKEMEGESQEALRYYDEAAATNSDAAATVTLNKSWRGRPADKMASRNAQRLRARLQSQQSDELKLAELNLRGVSALNRNDLRAADRDFRQAYALDPNNAFAVNNIGYLSEMLGDSETAQYFYDKARTVAGSNTPVGLATRHSAEGQKLFQVATNSDAKVEENVQKEHQEVRQERAPIVLRRRDNTLVDQPGSAPQNPQR